MNTVSRLHQPIKEQTKFWRMPQYDNMELLHATFITHAFTRHYHEWYAIGMIERNHYTFYYRGAMHTIHAGQIVVINPGEIHSGEAIDEIGWTYRMLYPGITMMRQIAYEVTGKFWDLPTFPQGVIDDLDLARAIQRCHMALEDPHMRLMHDTLIRDVFSMMILRHAENKPMPLRLGHERRAVALAKEYMAVHYADNITLEDLSSQAGLSPYHLARVFRAETGMAPHQYLINLRVNRARVLLESGLPIVDAATMTGFTDQSHLSRYFKRILGITPGQYSL
ncbi:AraC family transcriptional regulator [Phototrophicus methaneseepsis]|uniref:AraC family transcriptional regulator n=1 Tax=Phototrophicus methaneseepsis TaxID=2710758 RepID=A0A7S8ECB7_9CHLR|nr:AraC family transcriptional regulator [Phototrophicus methaneseepsis]QPC84311.1 AraC family transcriptional regulator [Phototrophicus methaneseepsis]